MIRFRHVFRVSFGRPVLGRITEDEATVEDAPPHPWVAGELAHPLADAVDRVFYAR
jgi:hypothetical protein